jgi:hypothetical protein
MLTYLVAFGVLLHVLFWGAGLALLAMPRRWLRFWPVMAAPAGCALQSLVVWAGAYAGLHGTNRYGWWSEVVPVVLLAAGLRRRGRGAGRDVLRLGAVWAGVAASLATLAWPLARASRGLTTASLGSCDAADYAAGARVLMEFAHADRAGFLGLTEVVKVMSVDNFFDFWLRLNHFTPSALIALNGTILHCVPYELTGILTAALLSASLPIVFWTARAVFGLGGRASAAVAWLYGFSAITGYAVYHVAAGQLLAAQAIAVLTWAGAAAARERGGPRRGAALGGVLAIGYALVLGSYNFILVVCLVPAAAFACARAVSERSPGSLARWAWRMLWPLAATGAVFYARVAGLAERFRLFRTYDFGWRIHGLSPIGWLGVVAGPDLAPLPRLADVSLSIAAGAAMAAALVVGARRGRRAAVAGLCAAVPVLLGYGYLSLRGAVLGTNASYDAYKLFSVFYPCLLPVFCAWAAPARASGGWRRSLAWCLAAVVAAGNLRMCAGTAAVMETPPLIVDRDLADLRKVEAMPGVASVNLLIPDMWSRLWANQFLLRKAQYFRTHTYEGRRDTPLRGEWDLDGGLVSVTLPDGDGIRLNGRFTLARVAAPGFLRAEIASGWHEVERLPRTSVRWRWTSGDAAIALENPHGRPLRVAFGMDARSLVARDVQLWILGRRVGEVRVGTERAVVRAPEFELPPGASVLELRSSLPPTPPSDNESRRLGFAAYGVDLEAAAAPAPSQP